MNAIDTNMIAAIIGDDTTEILRSIEAHTGTKPADVIRKLIGARIADLCEADRFLEQLAKDSPIWPRAKHLFDNYGPASLIDDIKALDPAYKTMQERYCDELGKTIGVQA